MGIVNEHLKNIVEEEAAKKPPLVWVDKKGEYVDLVTSWDSGESPLRYPLFAFEGSFLELMLAAREPLSKKHSAPCVLYLPGFTEKELRETPYYEAVTAGRAWEVSLEKVIRAAGEGLLRVDQIEYILSRDKLSALEADTLVEGMTSRSPELEEALSAHGEDGLIIAILAGKMTVNLSRNILLDHLDRVFGCTKEWFDQWGVDSQNSSNRELAWAFGAFLLCLEYASDLSIEPPSGRLARLAKQDSEYRSRASRILKKIRIEEPILYRDLVEKTELDLENSEKSVVPEGLGTLDTFRFEANIILGAALSALVSSEWNSALAYAEPRLVEEKSGESARTFWLKSEPAREVIWKWIGVCAQLGKELRNAVLASSSSSRGAIDVYVAGEWRIDKLHREYKLLTNSLNTQSYFPDIADYYTIRNSMNRLYRSWADARAHSWNELCEGERFAVVPELAQRGFFSRSVLPHIKAGRKTALVLVDALRYELGEDLAELLADYSNGGKLLSAMLAELPTITAVGMTALMPVENAGMLDPVFDKSGKKILGFRSGERQVSDPKSRLASLNDAAGISCEWVSLKDFLDAADKPLKKYAASSLLVITTRKIDTQGEKDDEDFGIDYFQPVLARLRETVEKLRSCGFERILITSDHGFLIGDDTVENALGSRIEGAERRHAFDMPRNGDRLCSVSLADLGWRVEDRDRALVLERGTHFLTNAKAQTFYHGGNSLQERIIPLISISGGSPVQIRSEQYRIALTIMPTVFGTHRIGVNVLCVDSGELFAPDRVELRLSAEPGFNIVIGDADGMRFTGDTVECRIGSQTIISFRVTSQNGGKTRIMFNQVSSLLFVSPAETSEYFLSETVSGGRSAVSSVVEPAGFLFPRGQIPDEYETAIMHLIKHGKLTETFLRNSLGSSPAASRKVRQFAFRIEEWKEYLPFSVTLHQTADGNEYRKQ